MRHTTIHIPYMVAIIAAIFSGPYQSIWAQNNTNLLESIDLKKQVVAGDWTLDEGELSVTAGNASRLTMTENVPASYSLTVEFTRKSGSNSIGFILPIGSGQCSLLISTFDGQAHGIGLVDTKFAADNETTIKPGTLENGNAYRLQVEVEIKDETATINSSLDGRPFLKWSGKPTSLTMFEQWKLPSAKALGIITYDAYAIHKMTLAPLNPAMRMVPAQTAIFQKRPGRKINVIYATGHGETAPGSLSDFFADNGWNLQTSNSPITADLLTGSDLLILRGPKQAMTKTEQASIRDYLNNSGSLLVVMDEERRTPLKASGINDFLKTYDLSFTEDTPYLHNCGAIATRGEVHADDREVPYSGGRATTGGKPFGYQLTSNGQQGAVFATSKVLSEGGGKMILLADGMAAALMGTPDGERLSGISRDPSRTVYWGKDSNRFMQEVIGWLVE